MRALLIKMSSLGDVVHAFPAITDAAAQGVSFDWVVEETFAEVAALHPAVHTVIPIAWRRWRRSLIAARRGRDARAELAGFVRHLRNRSYDRVLDAQGLIKSGVVTALARGERKSGLAAGSAREAPAAMFYAERTKIPPHQHAVDALRQLFAQTFAYTIPMPLDFGLRQSAASGPLCVLLHGSTWSSKLWPESMWIALARLAADHGLQVAMPWGDEVERARAQRIADAAGGQVWERASLGVVAERLASATVVVGVDSGLSHLSAALGVPTVALYGSTNQALTGCRGSRAMSLQAEFDCAPCLRRECNYQGPDQWWQDEAVRPACYSRVAPEEVWESAMGLMNADRVLSI